MSVDSTLVIMKPDAYRQRVNEVILERFTASSLCVVGVYCCVAPISLLQEHYASAYAKYGRVVGDRIVGFMSSDPLYVGLVRGDEAVNVVRGLCGENIDPVLCSPGTIRRDYSRDSYACAKRECRALENIIHSSDSQATAAVELSLWFGRRFFDPPIVY